MCGEGALPSQVQEQTSDTLTLLEGSAKMGLSLHPFLRGATQDNLSIL